jgi:hypothetical protein
VYFGDTKTIAAGITAHSRKGLSAVIGIIFFAILIHFSFYYTCLHIHVLPDGKIIIHSHVTPDRARGPDHPNHSHNSSQLIFIKATGLVSHNALISFTVILSIATSSIIYFLFIKSCNEFEEIFFYSHKRAPPC